jgi:hypothetical protein
MVLKERHTRSDLIGFSPQYIIPIRAQILSAEVEKMAIKSINRCHTPKDVLKNKERLSADRRSLLRVFTPATAMFCPEI